MGDIELTTFPNGDALAGAVADEWLRQVRVAGRDAPYCVALSGGRSARQFFGAVAARAGAEKVSLSSVHFFWADERCVPPGDPESNFRLAHELLLSPLKVPPDRVHRIRGEVPPETAATTAAAELCKLAPLTGAGQPVLDLVLLGMGEDGHVASLFPGEPPSTQADPAVYRAVTVPKPPPRRITLGYAAIAAARQVWVLVVGPGKEAARRQSLSAGGRTPLARVLQARARTNIFSC